MRKSKGYWRRPIPELAAAHPPEDGRHGGYIRLNINGRTTSLHRLVWEHFHGEIPAGMQIDHINGVRTDCRIDNLRLVTCRENLHNQGPRRNNTSGSKGCYIRGGRWIAQWQSGDKIRMKSFSFKKYGENARRLAEEYRAARLAELGYTARHI